MQIVFLFLKIVAVGLSPL